jgi:hypothetical protein
MSNSDQKKTKRKVKHTASKTRSSNSVDLSANEDNLSKVESNDVKQVIAQALIRYQHEQAFDTKQKNKELNHLVGICEEYLSSFALIGYTLEGEKVIAINHPTQKDEAALLELLRETVINMLFNT